MTEEERIDGQEEEPLEEGQDYKARYEQALEQLEQAEKYKGYFKKEKAKQKNEKAYPKQDIDVDSIREQIMQEVRFYSSNPKAEEFKDSINEYVGKGLTHDEAYRLVASKENPSLLIDEQTKNKENVAKKQLTGVASDGGGQPDFESWTDADVKKATEEELDAYWDYKKRRG